MNRPLDDIDGTPARDAEIILAAEEVRKEYFVRQLPVPVLERVSLRINRGEHVCIMGVSGAGKSTLMNILGGLDRPTGGDVFFDQDNLYSLSNRRRARLRASRIGFVFQAYHLLPELDVLENVLLPSMAVPKVRRGRDLRDEAASLLAKVGLAHRAHHRPMELSGGEQQRAAIARALINRPDVLLADEPTGNLDAETGEHVLRYLFEMIRDANQTFVAVTHNQGVAAMCNRTLVLKDGVLVE